MARPPTTTAVDDHSTTRAVTSQSTGPIDLPYFGDSADFPTWLVTSTRICATNYGDGDGAMRVQSWTGAPPDLIPVPPDGVEHCDEQWWFGVPVNVMNVGSGFSPISVTAY